MYIPNAFIETDTTSIRQFIEQFPLATMICHSDTGLVANHIPLILQADDPANDFPYHLIGHFAKANPVWQQANSDWLIIFSDNGSYISPSWYPTKALTHKEVPTWNYRAVHIYGKMHLITDSLAEKIAILDKLTQHFESGFKQPWHISDAPNEFVEQLTKVIIAFKFEITDIQCKYKMNQNKTQENIQGVVSGLETVNTAAAHTMAEAMKNLLAQPNSD